MKTKLLIIIWSYFAFINNIFAQPEVTNLWLPWDGIDASNVAWKVWGDLISLSIKYIAVIAVISLMISWILYLTSNWEEEQVKKAKNWIIWSLVWVFLSISAYSIINIVNNLSINN